MSSTSSGCRSPRGVEVGSISTSGHSCATTYDLSKCPCLSCADLPPSPRSLNRRGKEAFVRMSLIMPVLHCKENNAFLAMFFKWNLIFTPCSIWKLWGQQKEDKI